MSLRISNAEPAGSWVAGMADRRALLFLGFWSKPIGILDALCSLATFIGTVTIIPFMPGGWAASARGFPPMTGNVPFLMKDLVLLAASVHLLKSGRRETATRDRRPSDGLVPALFRMPL